MSNIRAATPQDAPGILAILNPIILETTITFAPAPATQSDVTEGVRAHANRGDPYLVAVDHAQEEQGEEMVVGFAKYGPFRAGEGYGRTAEITLHLAPHMRGKGLGPRLLKRLETHARAAGKHSLVAGISAENAAGLAFHRKSGFVQVGRIPQAGHKFGRFIDLVLMQKFL